VPISTSKSWNLLHILWVKALILLVVLSIPTTGFGQKASSNNYNFSGFNRKPYYFGIALAYKNSNFTLEKTDRFILNDSFRIAETIRGAGMTASVIANFKIGNHFDIRLLPSISLISRKFEFTPVDDNHIIRTTNVESVLAEIPVLLRYKSEPYRDKRLFVIGGFKYGYDVASNSKINRKRQLIRLSPHDFSLEIGAGIQFFLPYIIFSPEIKFSQGIDNILIYNNSLEQAKILEKVFSRSFTITLNFEG
jgi:hypothetical protein